MILFWRAVGGREEDRKMYNQSGIGLFLWLFKIIWVIDVH